MARVRIQTFGCQMNEAESLALEERLSSLGFRLVDERDEADAVLLNTCCVRRKAEERVFGELGHLRSARERQPGLVVGVIGCMAKGAAEELRERAPWVDFVLGPDQLEQVPAELVARLGSPNQEEGQEQEEEKTGAAEPRRPRLLPFKRFVPIMRGCDNWCTYCVVPYVRGPERSLPEREIRMEVARYAPHLLEVTLLGQNVNSYRHGDVDFPTLLGRLADEHPEVGFRFMTSHPKDLSDRLIETWASRPNVLRHLHLPLQAGADRVLQLMNRRYTVAHYEERVLSLRRALPGLTLTTDVICGFPSETEDEFAETLCVVERLRFDSAFMFYYSPRPHTKALELPGQLPEAERKERLQRLIALQQRVGREVNQASVGRLERVLVEKPSRRTAGMLAARTGGNKTLLFEGPRALVGTRVLVRVESADAWTLRGRLAEAGQG